MEVGHIAYMYIYIYISKGCWLERLALEIVYVQLNQGLVRDEPHFKPP